MAIEEKRITIEVGKEKKDFIISKFPATVGRELLLKRSMQTDGNLTPDAAYALSSEISKKALQYVKVPLDNGQNIELTSETLIDNHVPNALMLLKLENEIMGYNFDFLDDGEI